MYNYINKRKQLAEFKRLFYVAATRAKDFLFISSSGTISESNENSFLGLLKNAFNNDLNEEKLKIRSNLKFITKRENEFVSFTKNAEYEIPVIRELPETNFTNNLETAENIRYNFLINELNDNIKSEIISATKIAVYSQCPLKYHLIYDLGFSEILSRYKNYKEFVPEIGENFEFAEYENQLSFRDLQVENDTTANYSTVKGRLIHKALQDEINIQNLESFINSNLRLSNKIILLDEEHSAALKYEVINELSSFYSSSVFKELKAFKNYKNEFEVYTNEKDYFLYGIIDKVVFGNKFIRIVDYKTDKIDENEVEERAKTYFTQLKFYAYILSKLFQDIELFVLKIIFLKYPEKEVELELDKGAAHHFGVEIDRIVKEIRSSNMPSVQASFRKNLNHCGICLFAVNGKCIKTN
jgi:ATP-dependent helicase/nuclease subunit A